MKKKITTYFISALLLPVIVLLATQCQQGLAEGQIGARRSAYFTETEFEEKICWNGTIEEDFDGSIVLVVMDKKTGGINKRHEESFFGDFKKEHIRDLTTVTVDIKDALVDVENFHQILEIKLSGDSKENAVNVIRQLEKIQGILYAGPNYALYPGAVPDDSNYESQWGLNGTYGIQAPEAWDITVGTHDVKVGIIDTGISPHPDLARNLLPGKNFIPGANANDTSDPDGHGTHVAGIVGAVGNNSIGVSGVCWSVGLVPLKIGGIDVTNTVIDAIGYAASNGIGILNLSWWNFQNDPALRNAIANYTGLFVCIAGNGNNTNIDLYPNYPGSFSGNNIITVGAIDDNGNRSSFSNYGVSSVDLFAPGTSIYSTSSSGSYVYMSGLPWRLHSWRALRHCSRACIRVMLPIHTLIHRV
jgi:hypothetical protein